MRQLHIAFWPLVAIAAIFLASGPAAAQKKGADKKPDPTVEKLPGDLSDDPEMQRKLMQLPEGFEIQLVAMEPDVVNPIQMCFDARGRLWVACAPRYPQILPGQEPIDYVVILDDFDANGRARSVTRYVEGLTVPTGLAPGNGGVYVGQGESLVFFDGEPKATRRSVVLTGFGTQDTHHTLNTFRWGPEGFLYFNQGLYIKSTVETPYGLRQFFGGGIWQLRTDRLKLEVYDRSLLDNNTWGHVFDDTGRSFVASAWPRDINAVYPETPLSKTNDRELIPSLKITKVGEGRHCGAELISGRHFPDELQGDLLTGDFLTHRVQRWKYSDAGGRDTFAAAPPLVVSKHRKFRPIDIKMGPDGAVYVADLYQSIIQHNQINFRDPRRDHEHGRIWRIVARDRPLLPNPGLTQKPIPAVLAHLKDPEQWTRTYAKRALLERDRKEVLAALPAWTAKLGTDERAALETLWLHQGLDEVNVPLLTKLLRAKDDKVRSAATRVLAAWADRVPGAAQMLAAQASDPQPRVRLEAVLASTQMPEPAAVAAALRALEQPTDALLDFALRKTVLLHRQVWYPEFQAGKFTFDGKPKAVSFALKTIKAPDAIPTLTQMLREGKVPEESRAEMLAYLASAGGPPQAGLVLDELLGKRLSADDKAHLLRALRQAASERRSPAPPDAARLVKLFDAPELAVSGAAMELAGAWKITPLRSVLRIAAEQASTRQAAIAGLAAMGDPEAIRHLKALAADHQAYPLRADALAGLAALDLPEASRLAAPLLQLPTSAKHDPSGLYVAFLQRAGGAAALTQVLQSSPPSPDAAKLGLRTVVNLGVKAPALTDVLQKAAGDTGVARKLDAEGMQRFQKLVQTQGDAARGEQVFRRANLGCLQCHGIAGGGGRVGPDLATVGASAPVDYLIDSILLPSKVIKEGFTTAHIVTKDGRALSGIVLRESPGELVLRDPLRDEIVLPTADIEERNAVGSLMPAALDQSLTDAELVDLVRFLSELGRPGPYALTHVPVARRWQIFPATSDLASLSEEQLGTRLHGLQNGMPAYSMASGELPLGAATTFARCHVDAAVAGNVALKLNDETGVKVWLDGTPVKSLQTIFLSRGNHQLDLRIDASQRKTPTLRCELQVPAQSPAVAQFSLTR